jgi:hypothetical protein
VATSCGEFRQAAIARNKDEYEIIKIMLLMQFLFEIAIDISYHICQPLTCCTLSDL